MFIVFLGPPGVGKGTQCERVAKQYSLPHISTGDMMRAAIASGSALGQKVKGFVDAGDLVPGEIVVEVVADRLSQTDCNQGGLLDGFPRTVMQAEAMGEMFAKSGTKLAGVIQLTADEDELKRRLLTRAEQLGRSDDTPETIANRLEVYHADTAPLVSYYSERGQLMPVDGLGTPDEVFKRICDVLDGLG